MDLPCATIVLFLVICFFHVGSFDYIMNQIYNTLGPNYSAGWGRGHFLSFPPGRQRAIPAIYHFVHGKG